jgi:hypothetical protein
LSKPFGEGDLANRTLALKETTNSIKHPKKNENYNKILEKSFIFNLQTVSTARRHCRSSLSQSVVFPKVRLAIADAYPLGYYD